jgi:hypothetical protein
MTLRMSRSDAVIAPPSVLGRAWRATEAALLSTAERLTAGPRWRVRTVLALVALSYGLSCPQIDRLFDAEWQQNWAAFELQFAHPLVPRQYEPISHMAKFAFRLTVPVFAHIVGLHHAGALVLQVLSGVAVLWLSLGLFYRVTSNRALAAICTAGIATTFPGVAAFSSDYRGFFDGVAYALLLAAMSWRSPVSVFTFTLLAGFTDERALVATVFVALWWWLLDAPSASPRGVARWSSPVAAVAAGWVAYVILRLWLMRTFGLATPVGNAAGVGVRLLSQQVGLGLPFAAWSALESLWVPVAAAVLVVAHGRRWFIAGALVAGTAVMLAISGSVLDATRSISYVFPIVFVAVRILWTFEARKTTLSLLAASSAAAIVIPTYYVVFNSIQWLIPAPMQVIRLLVRGTIG